MRERFVLRDEIFGGTLFDRKLLRHEFINGYSEDQLPKEFEHWRAKTENLDKLHFLNLLIANAVINEAAKIKLTINPYVISFWGL